MAANVPKIEYGTGPTVINFDFPAVLGDAFNLKPNNKVNTSLSGIVQNQTNFVEEIRKMKFQFVSEAVLAKLKTLYSTWAQYGKTFNYFEDQNGLSFKTYQLSDYNLNPKQMAGVGANVFVYEIQVTWRRVEGSSSGDCMLQNILNTQVAAADITGLLYDHNLQRTAIIAYEMVRKTDSAFNIFRGEFAIAYRDDLSAWEITTPSGNGDDMGVTFSITAGGQIQYTSNTLAGTNYSGYIEFREQSLC